MRRRHCVKWAGAAALTVTAGIVAATAILAATAAPARAAWKPNRPVRFIVQYAAGGGVDVNTRIVSKHAERHLGQPVVVENITGAAGAIGVAQVAKAAPDGHTVFFMVPPVIIDGYMKKGLPYTWQSFKPVIQVTYEPNVLTVQKGGPLDKPPAEFIAHVKAQAGKVRMGIGGVWAGHDFARAILEDVAKVRFQRVPFDGGAPAILALLAGDVDVTFPYWSEVFTHVQAGKLNVVAVADDKRIPQAPNVPTLKEAGLEVVHGVWRILAVPAGTPDDVVAGLHDAFKKALDDPAAQKDLANANIPIVYRNTADSAKFVVGEDARYKSIVERLGLQPR